MLKNSIYLSIFLNLFETKTIQSYLMKKLTFYTLLIALTGFACLFFIEIGLRIVNFSEPKSTWLQMHDRGFMMNQSGGDALHTFNREPFRYTFSDKRTREQGHYPGAKNILVFGDSFTFGLLLHDHQAPLYHLNRIFEEAYSNSEVNQNVRFINAGVGGTGLADWVAQLQTSDDFNQVDGIMIIHNHHDFNRSIYRNLFVLEEDSLISSLRWRERSLKRWLDSNNLFKWIQEKSFFVSGLHTFLWTYYFEDLTDNFNPHTTQVPIPDLNLLAEGGSYSAELASKLYEELIHLTYERELPLFITTTGFIKDEFFHVYDRVVFSDLDYILTSLNIPFHDITPEFYDRINGDFNSVTIPGDGHPNAEGAALMAELIGAFMMNQLNVRIEDAQ